ncbi:uncharacterized protein TRAVEDRAFT_48044 [Trametes versicolor FP-101664 SS1]|uniref:uncharacterized protein n=1 Tax=Trametes versicolor (strain FP-101664) TaxID=717944 RepID=UPI00046246B3|nr:uncharacterized protein TRAVEDRAFT_48044 [Trametes versicolor FP-101664 SS1]EIW58901.1 hypothetical protein TRAVEDRAFT_48044 [Trametes versicolor FP-101664 SS1]
MSSILLPNTAAQILRKRSTPWPFHAAQSMPYSHTTKPSNTLASSGVSLVFLVLAESVCLSNAYNVDLSGIVSDTRAVEHSQCSVLIRVSPRM